ncbi:hypothetical protein M406DRAFT_340107 [Cryphonectria parasitica EP155]|uniref:Methyltransferase LaeA n=1 Tax=Cryphonectria parasitica (strain ATCC 38755 / EP155) TaxID=660469 RepID=A0A9P4Y183_CRYP1|nr:uncharacterized protein M406DRAFT_340107 [Cryphonectria parasitica EP155]KAF3764517.1 hypothetical protein M406DRAFT_340107 [Cryphonectria parasitica EP155]
MENGRIYSGIHHGRYLLPVDEAEMDRLDAMHMFFYLTRYKMLCSRHILDLNNPSSLPAEPRILDIGFGTAIWVLSVAEPHVVKGFDLCLQMQPPSIVPGVELKAVDVEEPWPSDAGESSWHLIHARMLSGAIRSWPRLYSHVIKHLIPGQGWIEHVEIDWDFQSDDGPVSRRLRFWADELLDAMDRAGLPMRIDPKAITQALGDAGFTKISQEVINVRVNGASTNNYDADAGRWFNLSFKKGFMSMSLAPLVKFKHWHPRDVEALYEEIMREVGDRANKSYCKL